MAASPVPTPTPPLRSSRPAAVAGHGFASPAAAAAARTAVLASSDLSFRQRVRETLSGLRWQVREALGGAEALALLEAAPAEALILDSWLPDLEIREFVREFEARHPGVDLVTADGSETAARGLGRSPRRNELLHALRSGQDGEAPLAAPGLERGREAAQPPRDEPLRDEPPIAAAAPAAERMPRAAAPRANASHRLPEFVGDHPLLLEVSRRVRLVAPRSTPVLIQGPTGTGKELVAKALHRLSPRALRPFVVLNCAAIPEALLEAELFGHTRGAFTGAVQGRVGRIEAAHGGTLFLDEIGEMPLPLQAKLLRFVECGELQRIGDNEPVRVDARIVAATHQALAGRAAEGGFRADLYYRLAVFVIRTPALAAHKGDVPALAEHFLARLGAEGPAKRLDPGALEWLMGHDWPGNVRELEHVVERGYILAEDRAEIRAEEIEFGEAGREWGEPGAAGDGAALA
jgi:DNA-binding NtrC family response regulator